MIYRYSKKFKDIKLVVTPLVNQFHYIINKKKISEMNANTIDIIAVSADEIFYFKDEIKAKVSKLANKGHRVNVVVDGCAQFKKLKGDERIEYTFNGSKLLKLCELDNELRQVGMDGQIKFYEFFQTIQNSDLSTCWDLDQVLDANEKIREVVWKIRKLELSPYETMVYIHKYLTQNYGYGYNTSDGTDDLDKRDSEKNRSIISAIQNKQTVCSGFTSMTKAIIDELNIPELTCENQTVSMWDATKKDSKLYNLYHDAKEDVFKYECIHQLSLININDPKYNIKGSYLDDVTWDGKNEDYPNGCGFAFFMYPVSNMTKLKLNALSAERGSRSEGYPLKGRFFRFGEIFKKGANDKPIPFDTFAKAVGKVYSLEKDFCRDNDFIKTAIDDIDFSLKEALIRQADDNPLAKKADTLYSATYIYDRNNNIKGVKFELKEKDSDMEKS